MLPRHRAFAREVAVTVLICRQCRVPVTTDVARIDFAFPQSPGANEFYVWDENLASARDRFHEPVREDLNGAFVVRDGSLASTVQVAGDRRFCDTGHEVGRRLQPDEADNLVALNPRAVIEPGPADWIRR